MTSWTFARQVGRPHISRKNTKKCKSPFQLWSCDSRKIALCGWCTVKPIKNVTLLHLQRCRIFAKLIMRWKTGRQTGYLPDSTGDNASKIPRHFDQWHLPYVQTLNFPPRNVCSNLSSCLWQPPSVATSLAKYGKSSSCVKCVSLCIFLKSPFAQ